MNIYIPFTYCLTFIPTGQRYYGVRYTEKEIAHPDQLWTTYFTSSNIIKDLITEYGKDSFTYQVRKMFIDAVSANAWETQFLTKIDAAQSPEWLNGHNGGPNFYPTEKSKQTQKRKCIEKYGVENHFQRPDVQEKVRETRSNKSEDDLSEIWKKIHLTNLERYGYENPFLNPIVQEQARNTCLEKYGYEYAGQSPEFQIQKKANSLLKTGYESSNQRPEVKLKLSISAKNRPILYCPHCDKSGASSQMKRWHFDNCRHIKYNN